MKRGQAPQLIVAVPSLRYKILRSQSPFSSGEAGSRFHGCHPAYRRLQVRSAPNKTEVKR